MSAVLVTVPTVTQNSLHPLSTSSITGFYGAGKDNIGKCTDNPPERHPIGIIGAPTSTIPHFYAEWLLCCNPPNLSWLWTGTE